MSLIVFVCGSNRSRSPMAASYFRKLLQDKKITDIEVASAGLYAVHGETVSWEAREALRLRGLEPVAIGTTLLLPKLVKTASLIVCMTEAQADKVRERFMSAKNKTRTLMSMMNRTYPVAEPAQGDLQAHVSCLTAMVPALNTLAEAIE